MKNLLTNRTLATFEKWYYENHCKSSIKFEDLLLWQKSEVFDWLYSQCETIQYAFAVEFFDSVGIYIEVDYSYIMDDTFGCKVSGCKIRGYVKTVRFETRKEALEKILEETNEIFNNKTSRL